MYKKNLSMVLVVLIILSLSVGMALVSTYVKAEETNEDLIPDVFKDYIYELNLNFDTKIKTVNNDDDTFLNLKNVNLEKFSLDSKKSIDESKLNGSIVELSVKKELFDKDKENFMKKSFGVIGPEGLTISKVEIVSSKKVKVFLDFNGDIDKDSKLDIQYIVLGKQTVYKTDKSITIVAKNDKETLDLGVVNSGDVKLILAKISGGKLKDNINLDNGKYAGIRVENLPDGVFAADFEQTSNNSFNFKLIYTKSSIDKYLQTKIKVIVPNALYYDSSNDDELKKETVVEFGDFLKNVLVPITKVYVGKNFNINFSGGDEIPNGTVVDEVTVVNKDTGDEYVTLTGKINTVGIKKIKIGNYKVVLDVIELPDEQSETVILTTIP